MKKFILLFFIIINIIVLSAQTPTSKQIVDLKHGVYKEVDNSPIYYLPFEKGTKRRVIQGAYSSLSHKGEIALDFKIKTGTIICAAREGVVTASYGESNIGGNNMKYIGDGNHVIIKHNDGSSAMYWHLQYKGALVSIGHTVKAGQIIGKSGSTGLSAFPHLHFEVNGTTANGTQSQIPVRFYTSKGIKYLKPLKRYKVV
jgi:murein DD-endopeptidase MepM/ murein hydrolase activator NlpD